MTNDVVLLKDDIPTVLAAGVLAATLAAVIHEAGGHGVGCLAEGGTITVLTSIWFGCQGAGSLTVVAGSAASLVAGLGCLLVLPAETQWWNAVGNYTVRSILPVLVFRPVDLSRTNGDTWAVLARMRHWPEWWRAVSISLGVACYLAATLAMLNNQRSIGQLSWGAILCGYTAGAFSAMLAGLLWRCLSAVL